MSQIQNSCLSRQTLLPPLCFMGAALLAERWMIQFFPGASKGGLMLAAGCASATSCLDETFHDIDHSYLRTLLGKVAAIAFATLCTGLIAHLLNDGRVKISLGAAARFAAVELAIAAVISYATKESALQREYRLYNEQPYLWIKLSKEERTEKALKFMKAGYPSIIVGEISKVDLPHPKTKAEWQALSPNELSWVVACENYDVGQTFFLYELMLNKGIEPVRFKIEKLHIQFLIGKQHLIDLFYQDMLKNPQFFYYQDPKIQQEMKQELFQDKDVLPPVEPKLSPQQITNMNLLLGFMWGTSLTES